MLTIYANFDSFDNAARAGGAMLDNGVSEDNFSFLAGPSHQARFQIENDDLDRLERKIKYGVTTTTGADALRGAADGGGVGLVVGALAALVSVFVPGVGIVVGGGALATALMSALATGVGGAAAGSMAGYMKDLGVKQEAAQQFEHAVSGDGCVLAVRLPKAGLLEIKVLGILEKYRAGAIHSVEGDAHGSRGPAARLRMKTSPLSKRSGHPRLETMLWLKVKSYTPDRS